MSDLAEVALLDWAQEFLVHVHVIWPTQFVAEEIKAACLYGK